MVSNLHPGQFSCSSQRLHSVRSDWKDLARNRADDHGARRWFANLLWVAFPGDSEAEVCEIAAGTLGVAPRTVRNWLRCENDAPVTAVVKVMVFARFERIVQKVEGGL